VAPLELEQSMDADLNMQLEKRPQGGALVKQSSKQDAMAIGLGAVSLGLWFTPFSFLALVSSLATILLSWESATSRDRRTMMATAAFALGALPLAFEGVHLVLGFMLGIVFKIAIIAIIGGAAYAGGRVLLKKDKDED
jgi:hypothetical protein